MLNKAMLIGHLGHDPEVRHFGVGDMVATLNMAAHGAYCVTNAANRLIYLART
jgi:single-stranded DNA-binding protein